MLLEAMHVHLEDEFVIRIIEIANSMPIVDYEGRLPGPVVFLEGMFRVKGADKDVGLIVSERPLHYAPSYNVDERWVYAVVPTNPHTSVIQLFCSFVAKTDHVFMGRDDLLDKESYDLAREILASLDTLFSLMAEPRFVEQTPFSRLKRSMAAKAIGRPALRHAWVKLGWTIGSVTRAKGNIPGSAPQRALHWVRAHWRRYDHQTPKAVHRPHREGWWVWIDRHRSGNPALGEVKHHYVPKLDDPGKSSRVVHRVVASKIAQAVNPEPYLT
jgi:hypothetical protein